MKYASVAGLLLSTVSANACLNDRDTLGFELHNKPDVQRALTGRFDRFPPLYYEMRIARLEAKKALVPDEYDDLAVALGRLGRNDEALAILDKKAHLPSLTSDDRYRLFANRGTMEAHKWFQDGAKAGQISLLKQAESDIERAIAINPKAHFGRERAQLRVLQWVMDDKTGKADLPMYFSLMGEGMEGIDSETALAGLIMLGGAWESPDMVMAIGQLARHRSHYGTVGLALMRFDELARRGVKPIDPETTSDDLKELCKFVDPNVAGHGELPTAVRFRDLRNEADDWHAAKTEFMMARLHQGLHPDTDPNFWDGWTEPPMPQLPTEHPWRMDWSGWGPFLAATTGVIILAVLYEVGRNRRLLGSGDRSRA